MFDLVFAISQAISDARPRGETRHDRVPLNIAFRPIIPTLSDSPVAMLWSQPANA
jgi:hypothetical protein